MDTEITSYSEINDIDKLKKALGNELTGAAISFVRIGYLLKLARDENYLRDTDYTDYVDFAYREFGLDKTQVSRFVRINDRFSVGGYSEHLKTDYQGYGSAKLSLMLTLPDEINAELSPEYSKSDIQTIKDEYDAEQEITPLEVMTEPAPDAPETDNDEFLALVVKQLNDEHPIPISLIHDIRKESIVTSDDVTDAYMPEGDKTYIIRISSMGRFTISMKESGISIVNTRTLEKSPVSWDEWMDLILEDEENRDFKPDTHITKEYNKGKVEKSTPIEKVEGEVVGTPKENTQPDESAGQSIDNVPQDNPKAAGEIKAAGDTDDDDGSDEDMMINRLKELISPNECYKIRELTKDMDSLHGYRDELDIVCEWVAQLHTITNNLYAKLAGRGV